MSNFRSGIFGLKVIGVVFLVFAIIYMGLVFSYRISDFLTLIFGFVLCGLGLWFFINSLNETNEIKRNYFGILAGLFLWGFLGEVAEHFELFDLASISMGPLIFVWVIIFLVLIKYLPVGASFTLSSFTSIWVLHYIMLTEYNTLGRKSWITYSSCAIFAIITIWLILKMCKSKNVNKIMAYAYFALLTGWCVLEYFWGWRILPGPWKFSE